MSENSFDREHYNKQEGLFRRFLAGFENVEVDTEYLKKLKEFQQEKDAVFFYVATHKSHIDGVLIGLQLHLHGLEPPILLTAEEFERIPVFGKYLKALRTKSIKRKFTSRKEQVEYTKKFISELEQELLSKNSILIFPEGGRSKNGKLGTDLSKSLFKAPCNAPDSVYIVPISISYDIILEVIDFVLETS